MARAACREPSGADFLQCISLSHRKQVRLGIQLPANVFEAVMPLVICRLFKWSNSWALIF